jgi:hypothetical protein
MKAVSCVDDTVNTLGLFYCDPILRSIVFEGDFEIVIFMKNEFYDI